MYEEKQTKTFPLGTEMFPVKKQVWFLCLGWLGFQIAATLIQIFVGAFAAGLNHISVQEALREQSVSMIVNATAYIGLLTALLLIAYTDILKLVKSFKQWQSYLAGAICFASIIAFNIIYGNIVNLLKTPVTDNQNQQALETMDSLYPVASMVIFGFVGPICEELTYRVGFFSLLKRRSRVLAYILTIVLFAFIHFNYSTKYLVNELLNLPYYAFAAFAFSFTYERFGFAGSVTAHIINNVFSLSFIATIH